MPILSILKNAIHDIGIKEVARRSGLSASTVSRVNSGQIKPSLEVVERISNALGFSLELRSGLRENSAPRLKFAKQILKNLRRELKLLGVRHAVIFGSVARSEDRPDSDIDICLDFGPERPKTNLLLKAEGKIIKAFDKIKVDILSDLNSKNNKELKARIEKDAVHVF